MPRYHHLMALLTVTIWSFSYMFIVRLGTQMSALGIVVLRKEIFAGLVLALLIVTRPSLRLKRKQWMTLIAFGLVAGPLYHVIFAWAASANADGVSRIDPGLLGLILATVPVHTGWLGWLFLRERVNRAQLIALGLGLAGVATVVWGRYHELDLFPRDQLAGPIAATISAIVAGGIAVILRGGRSVLPPAQFIAVGGVFVVLFCVPFHPLAQMEDVQTLTTAGWIAAGFLGIFGSGVAFITWAAALRGLSAVTAAMYLFLASILAALWGWLFDGHTVGVPFALGAALVLVGLVVMARGGKRRDAPS